MLKLSFVPLMFLSVFTFYIALLWILPYMEMTEVMFYRDLLGELTAQKEEEERAAQEAEAAKKANGFIIDPASVMYAVPNAPVKE